MTKYNLFGTTNGRKLKFSSGGVVDGNPKTLNCVCYCQNVCCVDESTAHVEDCLLPQLERLLGLNDEVTNTEARLDVSMLVTSLTEVNSNILPLTGPALLCQPNSTASSSLEPSPCFMVLSPPFS